MNDAYDLKQYYNSADTAETLSTYESWAENYDSENIGNGFRLPGIACAMIVRHVTDLTSNIYDAACGTGLIGDNLSVLGYQKIIGSDLSPAMLERAKRLGCYKKLYQCDLGQEIPEPDSAYDVTTCFGSLGPGHAPADCLDEFVRITRPGGKIIFNVRADTYAEQPLKRKVESISDAKLWKLIDSSSVFRSYYLIEPEVTSRILVFEVI
ncbi:MAG: class I SAM-dependent methyltransferase [Pseudomonadota bacterium]